MNFHHRNVSLSSISQKYVPNIRSLVQTMAWQQTGDKPLPDSMMTRFFCRYMVSPGQMTTQILVNTGSGNGSLPDGTKPLPESVFTNHQ